MGLLDVMGVAAMTSLNLISSGIVSEVAKELGIAIAIIGFVTISLERARVKSFTDSLSVVVDNKLEEIKTATKDAIFQGALPRDYYEQITKTMTESRFIRFDWIAQFDFEWRAGSAYEFLDISIDQSYRIKNISSFPEVYKIVHYESKDWDDKFPNTTRFRYLRAWLEKSTPFVSVGGNTAGDSRFTEKSDALLFNSEVELPSGAVLNIDVGSRKIMRDRQYESRAIIVPTLGAKFQVTAPPDLHVELEVPELLLGSMKDKIKVEPDEHRPDGRISFLWNVNRPLPPATYIFVNWRRVDQPPEKPIAVRVVTEIPPSPDPGTTETLTQGSKDSESKTT